MTAQASPPTGAELLVRRLRAYGVRHVFGYPGGPLAPLYDALYHEPAIRHILARDEQAAGFMADGYARATGRPGVCIAVCGPGAFNAATPILTAFSDSVPVLLINGQVPSRDPRSGYYHENDQLSAFAPFTKRQVRVEDPRTLAADLDRAWAAMTEGRPGPVLLDVPGKVLWSRSPDDLPPLPPAPAPLAPRPADIEALARLLTEWRRPLLMAGGGVITAGAEAELLQLAERLGAPVFNSLMGKCALPSDHPLAAGMPWRESTSDASDMASRISPLFAAADGLLAIGCRFTQVTTGSWALRPPAALAQIDIDPAELGRHYPVTLGVHADARAALRALLAVLPPERRQPWAPPPAPQPPWRIAGMDLSSVIRRVLPRDALVVADVTQLAYRMLVEFPVYQPRTFLHPAGAVSMGYGLPAALGARAALPDRVIVAVMGDGCFQITGMELATAVQEKLPVVVILVNDGSLSLIKAIQQRRYQGRYLGVDLLNPDFGLFAKAFGVRCWRADSEASFEAALREAIAGRETGLVEIRLR
ncbi:MAG TPA: thiamine pyrophosphate-binding protein [Gemmataceae bacterium]|nr:thiamine pyrophosphate-binding protein [Gemmataceae bacterium]